MHIALCGIRRRWCYDIITERRRQHHAQYWWLRHRGSGYYVIMLRYAPQKQRRFEYVQLKARGNSTITNLCKSEWANLYSMKQHRFQLNDVVFIYKIIITQKLWFVIINPSLIPRKIHISVKIKDSLSPCSGKLIIIDKTGDEAVGKYTAIWYCILNTVLCWDQNAMSIRNIGDVSCEHSGYICLL